jgi:N4-gp56 family major capsid protein
MANNTTINSELFQDLLVQSQFAMYENSIARAVSTVYDYPVGAGKSVSVPIWAGITASKPAEGVAPNASNAATSSKSIDLEEHVVYSQVTDFLRDSAQESVITSLATQSGLALAESLDKELIALFGSNAIAKSIGTPSAATVVNDLMRAAALIRAEKYQGPLFAVLNPLQAFGLKAALTATNNFQNATNLGNSILDNYFVGSIAGITILEHALVSVDESGEEGSEVFSSVGCVFAPMAFGLAQRGGISMETERRAKERATDVVMTAVAGADILRPEFAVKLIGNAE